MSKISHSNQRKLNAFHFALEKEGHSAIRVEGALAQMQDLAEAECEQLGEEIETAYHDTVVQYMRTMTSVVSVVAKILQRDKQQVGSAHATSNTELIAALATASAELGSHFSV